MSITGVVRGDTGAREPKGYTGSIVRMRVLIMGPVRHMY